MHCSQYFRFENSFVVVVVAAVVVVSVENEEETRHLALLRFSGYGILGNLLLWVSCIQFFLFRWFWHFSLLSFLILFIYLFSFTKMNISCGYNLHNETITTPSKRHSPNNNQTDRHEERERESQKLWNLNFRCAPEKINIFIVRIGSSFVSLYVRLIIDLAWNPFYFPVLRILKIDMYFKLVRSQECSSFQIIFSFFFVSHGRGREIESEKIYSIFNSWNVLFHKYPLWIG